MPESAKEATAFAQGKSRESLDENRMLVHSLMRCIEIVGEAASQTTREFREGYPEIPWRDIIAMRNRLIHAYFDVDLNLLWNTVRDDLPPLIAELEKILGKAKGQLNP